MIPQPLSIPDLIGALTDMIHLIPRGKVTTFGALARSLGDVTAARWVATYLKANAETEGLAWHRVVRADGGVWPEELGNEQRRRLRSEGVPCGEAGVELESAAVHHPSERNLLEELQRIQIELAARRKLRGVESPPSLVGGVDVSYRGDRGFAAYTLYDRNVENGTIVWHQVCETRVTFPYVTGYLAFRELPVLWPVLQAAEAAGKLAPVILVDGNGQLHPRRAGIATLLGVLLERPTVGIGKKLICGTLTGDPMARQAFSGTTLQICDIEEQGERLGMSLWEAERHKPLYVSPGHRIDVAMSTEVVLSTLDGHRLPEPLYWADRLSREAAKGA